MTNINGILDNFALPDVAVAALNKAQMRQETLESGVSRLVSAHDEGVAYRFFVHTEYNPTKSKAARYEVFDEIEMIEWYNDRYCHATERVSFLPPSLLSVDPYTGAATGRYAAAYDAFKKGINAPGTSLSKWGVLTDGEIATLAANGVFSVEQFAAMPRSKVEGKFPANFREYFERAMQFVAGKENRYQADKQAEEILALQASKAKLEAQMEEMREQLSTLSQPKKKGRPKKEKADEVLPEG